MICQVEITGSISHDEADTLRSDLTGARVVLSSGLSGDRILKLVGDFTAEHIAKMRLFALKLLGEDRIEGIKISRESVEIGSVSARDIKAAAKAITELLDKLEKRG